MASDGASSGGGAVPPPPLTTPATPRTPRTNKTSDRPVYSQLLRDALGLADGAKQLTVQVLYASVLANAQLGEAALRFPSDHPKRGLGMTWGTCSGCRGVLLVQAANEYLAGSAPPPRAGTGATGGDRSLVPQVNPAGVSGPGRGGGRVGAVAQGRGGGGGGSAAPGGGGRGGRGGRGGAGGNDQVVSVGIAFSANALALTLVRTYAGTSEDASAESTMGSLREAAERVLDNMPPEYPRFTSASWLAGRLLAHHPKPAVFEGVPVFRPEELTESIEEVRRTRVSVTRDRTAKQTTFRLKMLTGQSPTVTEVVADVGQQLFDPEMTPGSELILRARVRDEHLPFARQVRIGMHARSRMKALMSPAPLYCSCSDTLPPVGSSE